MASELTSYTWVTLPETKRYANKAEISGKLDALGVEFIVAVCQWCERYCRRKFVSRTYEHTGASGKRPRLTAHHATELWLPHTPVTEVTTLKLSPDGDAISEGWDQDFTVDGPTGLLKLLNGFFWVGREQYTEITYKGGYLTGTLPGNDTDDEYHIDLAARDLKMSVMKQAVEMAHRMERQADGFKSFSTDAGTFTFDDSALLPDVKMIWQSFQRKRLGRALS